MTRYKDVKEHFLRLDKTPKKKRYKVQCKHCLRAGQQAKIVTGRSSYYQSHLDSCEYYQATLPSNAKPVYSTQPLQWTRPAVAKFERLLVAYQHRLRLPDTFVECDETIEFYEFMCPGISAQLPSGKQLGGRILRLHGSKCQLQAETNMRQQYAKVDGKMNLLSDVWENVSKEHLMLSRLALYGSEMTFRFDPVGAEHHGIVIAVDLETLLLKAQEDGWIIGAIITDDAGQCGRARRILALRWPTIVFVRCFAHDVNNLVKQVLNSVFKDTARQAASVVNAINASSAKWLKYLTELQKHEYGKKRALITLCLTRWNSMQGCFASLLRSKRALLILSVQHADSDGWPSSLSVLAKPEFWYQLVEAEHVIRPLSVASFRLQRAENTLADVVVFFGEIYRMFAANKCYGEALVKCVEKRWKTCEQPLFMLALYLHPVYGKMALALPRTNVSHESRIQHFGVYYYRRLVDLNADLTGLRESLNKWFAGAYTANRPDEYEKPVPSYWTDLKREYPSCKLPVLALTVLSIAVSTATCERIFSEFCNIHTPVRNKMKAHKAVLIEAISEHSRQKSSYLTKAKQKQRKRIVSPAEGEEASDAEDAEAFNELFPGTSQLQFNPDAIERASGTLSADTSGTSPRVAEEPTDTSASNPLINPTHDDADEEAQLMLEFWNSFLDEVDIEEELEEEVECETSGDDLINAYEAIPDPYRPEFPDWNDLRLPQEKRLTGIRGYKATLADLFSSVDLRGAKAP